MVATSDLFEHYWAVFTLMLNVLYRHTYRNMESVVATSDLFEPYWGVFTLMLNYGLLHTDICRKMESVVATSAIFSLIGLFLH